MTTMGVLYKIPCLLMALLVSLHVSTAAAQPFSRVCAISEFAPVYTATRNSETGDYILMPTETDASNTFHPFAPTLDGLPPTFAPTFDDNLPPTFAPGGRELFGYEEDDDTEAERQGTNGSQLISSSSSNEPTWKVRQCPCAPDFYCHLDVDACGVPVDSQPAGCFAKSTKKTLLRNAWPLLMLWYSTIIFFLICTDKGRNARNFIWLKLCNPKHNERIVDQFLYTHGFISTNPFPTRDSPSQTPLDWLPVARPIEPREPTELALKTRIYDGPPTGGETQEEDCTCTICFNSLTVGDRVGKLPCRHVFHVDCLKTWLKKRNVCPLCLTSNAAAPRYADEEGNVHEIESDITDDDNQDNRNGEVEMARVETVEMAEQGESAPREAPVRRANPNFAQQLLAVSRI